MKKHIVIYISALRRGGAERVVINLSEYLIQKGFHVSIVTQYMFQDEYQLPEGVKRVISDIQDPGKSRVINFIKRYQKLRRIYISLKPDCILSFIGKNNFMTILATVFTKIPVISAICGEPKNEYDSILMRLLAKTLFLYTKGIIVPTMDAIGFFPFYLKHKVKVLANPLDDSFLRPRYEGVRDRRIVSVGRLDCNKNHSMIFKAFSKISNRFPEVRLVIYGEGEERSNLILLADKLGISDKVSLPGAVMDVADCVYTSSMFVLASYYEGGGPNVLTEAMCLGIPCISTDCPSGGPRSQIINNINGFLIPVGDVEMLVEKMTILLNDEEKAEEISRNAHKMQDKYSENKINKSWVEYLTAKMI